MRTNNNLIDLAMVGLGFLQKVGPAVVWLSLGDTRSVREVPKAAESYWSAFSDSVAPRRSQASEFECLDGCSERCRVFARWGASRAGRICVGARARIAGRVLVHLLIFLTRQCAVNVLDSAVVGCLALKEGIIDTAYLLATWMGLKMRGGELAYKNVRSRKELVMLREGSQGAQTEPFLSQECLRELCLGPVKAAEPDTRIEVELKAKRASNMGGKEKRERPTICRAVRRNRLTAVSQTVNTDRGLRPPYLDHTHRMGGFEVIVRYGYGYGYGYGEVPWRRDVTAWNNSHAMRESAVFIGFISFSLKKVTELRGEEKSIRRNRGSAATRIFYRTRCYTFLQHWISALSMTLRILFILSPSGKLEIPEPNNAYWVQVAYTKDVMEQYLNSDAVGYYFEVWPGKSEFKRRNNVGGDYSPVLVNEVLNMAIRWGQNLDVSLELMSWEWFRDLVLAGEDTGLLREHVLICFLVAANILLTRLKPVLVRHFMSKKEELIFVERLESLSSILLVWPPPRHALFLRHKYQVIQQLDLIARTITMTNRPRTTILTSVTDFTACTVLKREGLCQSKHRHFYDGPSSISTDILTSLINHNTTILAPRGDASDNPGADNMIWMVQDVVEPLRTIGEWRVFVVGGKIIGIVGTTPVDETVSNSSMKIGECIDLYSLKELAALDFAQFNDKNDILVRSGGTLACREAAKRELAEFILATWTALLMQVKDKLHTTSPLYDFVRMDVGFIAKNDGHPGYDYFVNEVEFGGNDVGMFIWSEPGWLEQGKTGFIRLRLQPSDTLLQTSCVRIGLAFRVPSVQMPDKTVKSDHGTAFRPRHPLSDSTVNMLAIG
ncbi:hypothetical protein FB451DRAFT_1180803 [Mycena latifolia]|nr:hypothetical protein FB451DRAFT_1180803 [Mycena latifolia]